MPSYSITPTTPSLELRCDSIPSSSFSSLCLTASQLCSEISRSIYDACSKNVTQVDSSNMEPLASTSSICSAPTTSHETCTYWVTLYGNSSISNDTCTVGIASRGLCPTEASGLATLTIVMTIMALLLFLVCSLAFKCRGELYNYFFRNVGNDDDLFASLLPRLPIPRDNSFSSIGSVSSTEIGDESSENRGERYTQLIQA